MLTVDLILDVVSPLTVADFQAALSPILENLGQENATIEILMTNDARMQTLNQRHRGIDKTTDVLSLPTAIDTEEGTIIPDLSTPRSADVDLGAQDDKPLFHLGTIVISLPQAQQQVGRFGDDLESELLGLTAHGLHHLLGHDHDDSGQWLPHSPTSVL